MFRKILRKKLNDGYFRVTNSEVGRENDSILNPLQSKKPSLFTKPGYELLDEMAKKYKKTQSQIALNWLISKKNIVTIVKSSNLDHLKSNLGAIGWNLEKEDIEKLDNGFNDKNPYENGLQERAKSKEL